MIGRRTFLRTALAAGGALAAGDAFASRRGVDVAAAFRPRPWSVDLPLPRVLAPGAAFDPRCFRRAEWLGARARFHTLTMREGTAEIVPGVPTPIWGYDGEYPGPTLRSRAGDYVFVRFENRLQVETVIHLHGGHMPADSDGFPDDYIHPGESRDYAYPMLPAGNDPGERDLASTLWYHDHTMDETGPNVYRGLAGYFLVDDELEEALVADGRIPGPAHELPLLLQDRSFNADGTLFYDFFDHDGFLGDVQVVNGRLQPRVTVERRRYRLRLLNGANARMFDLRLTSGDFLQIGADGWALPRAVRRRSVFLGMAERADVIVDFRGAPDEVFLANWCEQDDGRGPGGGRSAPDQLDRGVPLLRFDVRGAPVPNDLARPLQAGEVVKPLAPPPPPQRTRSWVLERKNGVWVVNDRIFDPDRPFAVVPLGATERWTFENKSGGWWHPVHVHDEAMHVRTINGRAPPPWEAGKRDMVNLGPNDRLEAIIQFRDWPGRWVWHCHNVEHEDMRMMARFDVR